MEMRVADFIFNFLEKKEINTVFTVSGGGSIFMNDALSKNEKIDYVACHHEQAASISAEAKARSANKTGVALVTSARSN